MGETPEDRAAMLVTLSCLNPYPESVPINALGCCRNTMEDQNKSQSGT